MTAKARCEKKRKPVERKSFAREVIFIDERVVSIEFHGGTTTLFPISFTDSIRG